VSDVNIQRLTDKVTDTQSVKLKARETGRQTARETEAAAMVPSVLESLRLRRKRLGNNEWKYDGSLAINLQTAQQAVLTINVYAKN